MMKKFIFAVLLYSTIVYSQPVDSSTTGSIDSSVVSNLISDSLSNFRLQIDTILTGTATINLGADPKPDSVVVTYYSYETDPPSDTGKIIVMPLSDMKGRGWWIKWATSEQFLIKLGDIAFEAINTPIYFRWYAIKRKQ